MSKAAQNTAQNTVTAYALKSGETPMNNGQPYTRFSVALKAAKAEMAKGNPVTINTVKVRVTRVATVETA